MTCCLRQRAFDAGPSTPEMQSSQRTRTFSEWVTCAQTFLTTPHATPDVPLASATADMNRWSRVLLSRTLDAARSY